MWYELFANKDVICPYRSSFRLRKVNNELYIVKGVMVISNTETPKDVIIDGEVYTSAPKIKYSKIDIDEAYYQNHEYNDVIIDEFEIIGRSIKIKYPEPKGIYVSWNNIKGCLRLDGCSENNYIKLLQHIISDFDSEYLTAKGKSNQTYRDEFLEDFIDNNRITIDISSYGFNNVLRLSIDLRYIYENELDLNAIIYECRYKADLKTIFQKVGYEHILQNVILLFSEKIKYKRANGSSADWRRHHFDNVINRLNSLNKLKELEYETSK